MKKSDKKKIECSENRNLQWLVQKSYILSWISHLRYVNNLVDCAIVKASMLSLFILSDLGCGKYQHPRQIYDWFRVHFRSYNISPNSWLVSWPDGLSMNYRFTKNVIIFNQDISRCFYFGYLVRRLVASVSLYKCSGEVANLLFASLLRILGFGCRIVMFIPPRITMKNRLNKTHKSERLSNEYKEKNFVPNIYSWIGTTLDDDDRRPELWLEIFCTKLNEWIAVDVHRGGWDFIDGDSRVIQSGHLGKNDSSYDHNQVLTTVEQSQNYKKCTSTAAPRTLFSKLHMNLSVEDSSSSDEESDKSKQEYLPIIPLKTVKLDNKPKEIRIGIKGSLKRKPTQIELEEERAALAFEFTSTYKKTSSIQLLKNKIDICKTSIKYKNFDNIGWWILTVNEKGYIRDTTCRYTSEWVSVLNSRRNFLVDYMDKLIKSINQLSSSIYVLQIDMLDEFSLERRLQQDPLPCNKNGFKRHPKYVLMSCLSPIEIIYPQIPIIGYFQGEPVYPRENVQQLKTTKQWSRQQRRISSGQIPIKTIKDTSNNIIKEFYAEYQTELVPIREITCDNQVPVNQFHNVDLTNNQQVPLGCIHVEDNYELSEEDSMEGQGSFRSTWIISWEETAKRANISYGRALVGFKYSGGYKKGRSSKLSRNLNSKAEPLYNGIVIKEEDYQKLLEKKNQFQEKKMDKMAPFMWKAFLSNLEALFLEHLDTKQDYKDGSGDIERISRTKVRKLDSNSLKRLSAKLFNESLAKVEEGLKIRESRSEDE
ncbi:DNA repair protein RAD4 [Cryptosporidium andersoni]|uniref:DNA repair protein RAD4 n=1 Tax=Cryptosporidium andersoni TaxID=117008 RepID=A0A1J4MPC0_9CRYT|nr:DNA repair protein RAD4 [Cryptosporidium andersoni]